MIGRLTGTLTVLEPGVALVDVGGVGYIVSVSLRDAHRMDGVTVSLWIHTSVREDAIQLFGFSDRVELTTFQRLIAVAGVGPRSALGVLSVCTPADVAEAVEAGDIVRLQRAPGVGRKTAERIVLELRGRLSVVGQPGNAAADAASALVNLGYSQRDALRAVDAVRKDSKSHDLSEVIRLALQRLAR